MAHNAIGGSPQDQTDRMPLTTTTTDSADRDDTTAKVPDATGAEVAGAGEVDGDLLPTAARLFLDRLHGLDGRRGLRMSLARERWLGDKPSPLSQILK